jgi:hypothetical protein
MDVTTTPDLILCKALATRLGAINGLSVQTRPGQALARTAARVFPYRSTFTTTAPDDPLLAGIYGQQGVLQSEAMQFEIGVIVTDLSFRGNAWIVQNEIIKAVSGFQPYLGTLGASNHALSPFYPAGAIRAQAIRTQKTPIYERVIMVECVMQRYNGLPPRLTKNPHENTECDRPVDIMGYMPWELC